jgi:hypothetical protein
MKGLQSMYERCRHFLRHHGGGATLALYGAVVGAGIWLSLSSCKDSSAEVDISNIVFPDSNVSYGKQVEPLFLRACALPGCHDNYSSADNVNLDTYREATARIDVIYPGHPELSLMVKSVDGTDAGKPRMPLNLNPLNANQIHGLRQWVLEGAQNN